MKILAKLYFIFFSVSTLWSMQGLNTSITMADQYLGISQFYSIHWEKYLSSSVNYNIGKSGATEARLNSLGMGMSATFNDNFSYSANFSQGIPSNGYAYTNISHSLTFNTNYPDNFYSSFTATYARTLNSLDYKNEKYQKNAHAAFTQQMVTLSGSLTIMGNSTIGLDYSHYYYDITPDSYNNSVGALYASSLDAAGKGNLNIFTMSGIASGATQSSLGANLSHQIFETVRGSVNIGFNRTYINSIFTRNRGLSLTYSYTPLSFTFSYNQNYFLIPTNQEAGQDEIKRADSYTLSVYWSIM